MAFLAAIPAAAGASAATTAATTTAAASAATLAATTTAAGVGAGATMSSILAGTTAAATAPTISLSTILSGIVSAAMTGVSALSQLKQGESQAEILKHNQDVSNQQAAAAEKAAGYEEGLFRRKIDRLKGQQVAGYADAGISSSEGSPLQVLVDTAGNAEMDAAAIQYKGAVQGAALRSEGDITGGMADLYKKRSWLEAGGTLLTGAARNPWVKKRFNLYDSGPFFSNPSLLAA